MRIGDKVYCIKDRSVYNLKGKTYTILYLNKIENTVHISLEESEKTYIYCAYQRFLTEDSDHYNKYLYQEHFITNKEYRKLKLKKLNESR